MNQYVLYSLTENFEPDIFEAEDNATAKDRVEAICAARNIDMDNEPMKLCKLETVEEYP